MVITFIFFIKVCVILNLQGCKITVGKNGHLIWHWIDIKYLNIILLFFWLYAFIRIDNYLLFIFGFVSILYSIYNYYEYKTFGSMWCYIGNLLWIIILIDAIYKKMLK